MVVADIDDAAGEALVRVTGHRASFVSTDVRDDEQVEHAVAVAHEHRGRGRRSHIGTLYEGKSDRILLQFSAQRAAVAEATS